MKIGIYDGTGLKCEHGRIMSQCNECGGSSICEHCRIRSDCKECGGGSICEHGRQGSQCKELRRVTDLRARQAEAQV